MTPAVGSQPGLKPLSRGKPSQDLPLIELRETKTLDQKTFLLHQVIHSFQ